MPGIGDPWDWLTLGMDDFLRLVTLEIGKPLRLVNPYNWWTPQVDEPIRLANPSDWRTLWLAIPSDWRTSDIGESLRFVNPWDLQTPEIGEPCNRRTTWDLWISEIGGNWDLGNLCRVQHLIRCANFLCFIWRSFQQHKTYYFLDAELSGIISNLVIRRDEIGEWVRVLTSCAKGCGFETRPSQTSDIQNWYLLLPSVTFGMTRIG